MQTTLTETEKRVEEVDNLLANVDASSQTYSSLTTIKQLMESLASAFAAYLSLLQTNSASGRVKRDLGNLKVGQGQKLL